MSVGIRIWDLVIDSLSFLDLNQNKLHLEKVYFLHFCAIPKEANYFSTHLGKAKRTGWLEKTLTPFLVWFFIYSPNLVLKPYVKHKTTERWFPCSWIPLDTMWSVCWERTFHFICSFIVWTFIMRVCYRWTHGHTHTHTLWMINLFPCILTQLKIIWLERRNINI